LTYVANSLSYLGFQHEKALSALNRALALNPNSTRTLLTGGWIRTFVLDTTTAIEYFHRVIRLNPLDPEIWIVLSGLAQAHMVAGRFEEALPFVQRALIEAPNWVTGHMQLISCLVHFGRIEEANSVAQRLLEIAPQFTISDSRDRYPIRDSARIEKFCVDLQTVAQHVGANNIFLREGYSWVDAGWHGDGTLAFSRTRFRGVWMNSASASIRFGDGVLALEDFRVTRDEGIATGSFAYDSARNELRLTNVQATLKPGEAIMWIEPRFWEHVAPYRFHHTPHVMANGAVQFGAGKQTHLQIDVNAPGGMDYTFIDKVLPFDRIAGQLLFTDDRLQILGLKGRLFSGDLDGSADISLAKNDRHYTAKIAVEKTDFPKLTDLYFKYKTSEGDLSGRFDFTGVGSDARFLKGEGLVKVTNGNVFAIPIFGPLSELVSKMFAGVGYSQP
jgi:tetratricopeptide (TPR) repeat protein